MLMSSIASLCLFGVVDLSDVNYITFHQPEIDDGHNGR